MVLHTRLLAVGLLAGCFPNTRAALDSVQGSDSANAAALSAPSVHITPTAPTDVDTLTCAAEASSDDHDGDALTYSYAWSSDAGGSGTGPTLNADLTTAGESWTCSVTASDGARTSEPGTASVEIGDSFIDYATAQGGTMVAVSAGSFDMGSATGEPHEGPVHTVVLTHRFWIGQTEITQAQYLAGTGTNPSYFSRCGDACPVEKVSWPMAAMYANALSAAEGVEPCYSVDGAALLASFSGDPYACEGYRMPTEAEWEYAARAGESFPYAGSATVAEVAWTYENSSSSTHAAAGKSANAWGLYDLSGNVWEWTGDWDAAYASDVVEDPAGSAAGSLRVLRGGSWGGVASFARVTARNPYDPSATQSTFGFRLARTAPPAP